MAPQSKGTKAKRKQDPFPAKSRHARKPKPSNSAKLSSNRPTRRSARLQGIRADQPDPGLDIDSQSKSQDTQMSEQLEKDHPPSAEIAETQSCEMNDQVMEDAEGGSDDNKHTGSNNLSPCEQPHALSPEVVGKEERNGEIKSGDGDNSTTHEPGNAVDETEDESSGGKQPQVDGGRWQIPGGWLVSVLGGLRASIRGAAS